MLFSTLALLTAALAGTALAKKTPTCTNGDYAYGGTTYQVYCNRGQPAGKPNPVVGNATTSNIDTCIQACINYDGGEVQEGCFSVTWNRKTDLCLFHKYLYNTTELSKSRILDLANYSP